MRPFSLILLLLASPTLFAQSPALQKPTSVVTGHVYCGDTNAPARFATVVLEPAAAIDGYSQGDKGVSAHMSGVETLPDGSFTVPHVAPGRYYVFVSAPGYVSPLSTIGATSDQMHKPDKAIKEQIAEVVPHVTVQAKLPASIDISLQRGAAVSGTVSYDDGSPATGLSVKLLVQQKDKWVEPQDGPFQGSPAATTDDRGAFRITSLPAGTYLLAVDLSISRTHYDISPNGYGMSSEGDYTIPIYSGSKLRPKDATPFELKLGEERAGEDLEIPLAKLHSVSGIVVAAHDGHGINGGTVSLLHADDRSEEASTKLAAGANGWTLSFVPEGDYIVRVTGAADVDYEQVANPPGTTPPVSIKTHILQSYGAGEQPLHVGGDVTGLAVAVPDLKSAAPQGSQ